MNEMLRLVIVTIIFFICFFAMLTGGTFFHEKGHLMTAREYIPDIEAVITLSFPAIQWTRLDNCKVVRGKFDKEKLSAGDTEMEYTRFTPEQIKHIAQAGIRGAIKFYAYTGAISIALVLLVCLITPKYEMVQILLMGVCYILLATFVFTLFAILKFLTAKAEWCDRNIIKDPKGFLENRKENICRQS